VSLCLIKNLKTKNNKNFKKYKNYHFFFFKKKRGLVRATSMTGLALRGSLAAPFLPKGVARNTPLFLFLFFRKFFF
jgi:hypothetical protein